MDHNNIRLEYLMEQTDHYAIQEVDDAYALRLRYAIIIILDVVLVKNNK